MDQKDTCGCSGTKICICLSYTLYSYTQNAFKMYMHFFTFKLRNKIYLPEGGFFPTVVDLPALIMVIQSPVKFTSGCTVLQLEERISSLYLSECRNLSWKADSSHLSINPVVSFAKTALKANTRSVGSYSVKDHTTNKLLS